MNKTDTIESFSNLIMYPMTMPNTGCVATGTLASGCNITVTGGNTGQAADGVENFLVEVVDTKQDKVITKKNMHRDELSLLIEHHYKNRNRKRRPYRGRAG
jgi:hypothetical protein